MHCGNNTKLTKSCALIGIGFLAINDKKKSSETVNTKWRCQLYCRL